jgi:hypothetical protein
MSSCSPHVVLFFNGEPEQAAHKKQRDAFEINESAGCLRLGLIRGWGERNRKDEREIPISLLADPTL